MPSSLTQRVSSAAGRLRVLHRQRREGGKAVRALAHFARRAHRWPAWRPRSRVLDVVDRLHRRRVERQDHHLDPVLVHFLQARVLDVEQALAQVFPDVRAEHLRVAERRLDGEMLFERDLALHVRSPGCAAIYLRAVFLKKRRRRRVSLQAPRQIFGRVEDCARVVCQRESVRRPYFGEYRRISHRTPPPFGAAAFARFAREPCLACQPSAEGAKVGGARRDRTADLVNAIHALSHLSYGPNSQNPSRRFGKAAEIQLSSSFSMTRR